MSGQRIAVFGGSFDPPHWAHLAIARAAASRFDLDPVLFAPAGRQPLKRDGASATYAQRLAMVALACAADTRFRACDLDAPRPDGEPNYTIDLLTSAAERYPAAELFSLAGADSFRSLGKWRDAQGLLAAAQWIVVSRPGYQIGDPAGLHLTPAQRARIHTLNTVHEEGSATGLRERLARGEHCSDLLPAPVAAFIEQNGLYRAVLP